MKKENYQKALFYCDKTLAADEMNVKALFRRGSAYTALKEYDKAEKDLKSRHSVRLLDLLICMYRHYPCAGVGHNTTFSSLV